MHAPVKDTTKNHMLAKIIMQSVLNWKYELWDTMVGFLGVESLVLTSENYNIGIG